MNLESRIRNHRARARRVVACALVCLAFTGTAAAQQRPATLSTLFEDIFGPRGLVLNSDDVQLDGTNHAAHFNSAFQSEFRLMNVALTSQLATVPLPSPASGFTYTFDSATGTFVRSTRSFGPILTDRGETIGRGRIAFGYTYQFFSYDHLDGVSLAAVPAVFTHDDREAGGGRADVVATSNTIEATVSQLTGALTYGVSDRIDLSLAVPVVRTRLALLSNATIHRIGTGNNLAVHYFRDADSIGGYGSTRQFFAEGSAAGVGDLVARAKATLLREGSRALAVGVDLRLPTGDEQNLLGSGAMGVRPFAALSASLGPLAPHANVAYQWNGKSTLAGSSADVPLQEHDDHSTTMRLQQQKGDLPDQFSYALGADLLVASRLSVVFDLFGQRVVNSPRLVSRLSTLSGVAGSVTLPNIQFETESYWTSAAGFGLKGNIASRMLVTFNLRFAVADGGLTDRLSPLVGVEWAF
ncbi:MAG: hypothetical protein ACRD15_03750 [Vicinamibacterales bacterium]